MPDVKDVIAKLVQDNAGSNVAGYVDKGIFYYEISRSEHLPAAAFLFDSPDFPKKANIYTNLRQEHWLYTYKAASTRQAGLIFVDTTKGDVRVAVTDKAAAGKRSVKVLAGEAGEGPLGNAGGLFKAAKDLEAKPAFYKGKANVDIGEKAMHRALRYYMLAAYAALGQCAKADYEAGNYVCALAVSDNGQIVSWGVNSGSFHHGEVNMLLNYFGDHPTATQLPPKTIVFSTLTPCKQCSNFIQTARPGDAVIFMGQADTGDFGKEGEAYGKYLRELTDPVRARVEKDDILQTTVKVENKPTPTKTNPDRTTQVKTLDQTKVAELTRYGIDDKLRELIADGNIAGKIGDTCKSELIQSYTTITHKFTKVRPPAEELSDQLIKVAVLTYLRKWLTTVGTTTKTKTIL